MNALALVQEAVERFVPIDGHLDKISISLEELHDFVYIWGIDRNRIFIFSTSLSSASLYFADTLSLIFRN